MDAGKKGGARRRVYILGCAAVIAVTVAGATSAMAGDDFCVDQRTRQIDRQATAAYQQLERNETPRLMRLFNGVWFHQTRNPGTGQTEQQYQQYQQNGLWQYRDRVCSADGFCTQYAGTGLFAVRINPNVRNGFFGTIIVSDSNRNHQCVGLNGRFLDRNHFVDDASGIVSQRVQ